MYGKRVAADICNDAYELPAKPIACWVLTSGRRSSDFLSPLLLAAIWHIKVLALPCDLREQQEEA